MSSPINGVDLVEVGIFYKSEKTSGQAVKQRIKTVSCSRLPVGNVDLNLP